MIEVLFGVLFVLIHDADFIHLLLEEVGDAFEHANSSARVYIHHQDRILFFPRSVLVVHGGLIDKFVRFAQTKKTLAQRRVIDLACCDFLAFRFGSNALKIGFPLSRPRHRNGR